MSTGKLELPQAGTPAPGNRFSAVSRARRRKEVREKMQASAKGGDMEYFISVALFTGIRMSDIRGLTWDTIDFDTGTISINKQLAMAQHRKDGLFITPKSGKPRTITAAPSAIAALRKQRTRQIEMQLKAGPLWENPYCLVFTSRTGEPIEQHLIHEHFVKLLRVAGLEGVRLHDLRHTYAVNAIRADDDIKSIQSNLGHDAAAFTQDKYGHFTECMAKDSAARMESFIKNVLNP